MHVYISYNMPGFTTSLPRHLTTHSVKARLKRPGAGLPDAVDARGGRAAGRRVRLLDAQQHVQVALHHVAQGLRQENSL